jgi:hypothetical protein
MSARPAPNNAAASNWMRNAADNTSGSSAIANGSTNMTLEKKQLEELYRALRAMTAAIDKILKAA